MSDFLTAVTDLWTRCYWPNPGGLKLLGLRGCSVADGAAIGNGARYDHFDDTLVLFDEAAGRIDHVPCTASQPGDYWVQQAGDAPWARPGCARFTRGVHRGEYPCLVQDDCDDRGTMAVIRLRARTFPPSYDPAGADQFDYCLETGIHIHHADAPDEERVGIWSDGCTVVQDSGDGERWGLVKANVWGQYAGQASFWYGIAPFAWLGDGAQRLLWGSIDSGNQAVTQLQQLLADPNHDGAKIHVTGRFDRATDEAYRCHQRNQGVVGTGVCENPAWLVKPA